MTLEFRPVATYLDRRALKRILDAANALRKAESGPPSEAAICVYLARGDVKKGRPLQALRSLHKVAIETFGGKVVGELTDGVCAVFDRPADAVKTALHAIHAADLAEEFLEVASARVVVVRDTASYLPAPASELRGPALDRAVKLGARARNGEVVVESSLFAELRDEVEGRADIEIDRPRSAKVPGMGTVETVAIRPLGLPPERERELLEVDAELRARPRR